MRRLVTMGGVVALALATGSGVATAQPPDPAPPVCAPGDPQPGRLLPDPPRADDPADPGATGPCPLAPGPGPAPTLLPVRPPGDVTEPTTEPTDEPRAAAQPQPPRDDDPDQGAVSAGHETSAAAMHGWGEPTKVEEFDGPLDDSWNVYDGPGHAGKGRRTPDAVTVADGELTITGSSRGHTAGMAWHPGQKYGRWEGRVRAPASDPSYNALLLLWPTAENFPVGGEIDFMEMTDHTRQSTQLFLHYGPNNDQVFGEVEIDGTRWNNWAVEWTPSHVAAFVNGKEWWRTTDTSILPPGPMHLCIQLDWFPKGGNVQESSMHVDWVKQYALSPDEIVDDATESIDERIEQRIRDGFGGPPARRTEGGPDAGPLRAAPAGTGAAQRAPSQATPTGR